MEQIETKSEKLGFAEITILQENLAEVVVHQGVEITIDMVHTYHQFLLNNLVAPFGILINKLNSYTYTFDAQMNIANLPEIKAMAVVSYNGQTIQATNSLIQMPRKRKWNIFISPSREIGLEWLHEQLE